MMTKTNKKSSTMARVALGATAALALAGHATATCSANQYLVIAAGGTAGQGTCTSCPAGTYTQTAANQRTGTANTFCNYIAAGYYGTVGVLATSHATVTKCPTGSSSTASTTTTTIAACTTSAGYYLQVASATTPTISQAPAGWFAAGGEVVSTSTNVVNIAPASLNELTGIADAASAYSNAKIQPCTAVFTGALIGSLTTEVGSSASSACKVKAGYYIQTAAAGTAANLVTANVPANTYSAALTDATGGAAATPTACPFAGTSAVGSYDIGQCTPDCATTWTASNAVAQDGTCVCKAGTYGSVVDLAGATTAAAYNGCTACTVPFYSATAAGVTSFAGAATAADCVSAPGYIISSTVTLDNAVTVAQVPANSYARGGSLLGATGIEVATQCPEHSTSAAGSNDITDCKCVAGYSSTAKTCEYCPGQAAGTAVGTHTTCAWTSSLTSTPGAPGAPGAAATSGASSTSVFAAVAAIAAAQLAF